MLLTIAAISLLHAILSIPAADDTGTLNVLEGDWEVLDGYFGDSNVNFVHIGTLSITDSQYLFIPEQDAFISQEMRQRFGFITKTAGILRFEYREGVDNTGSYQNRCYLECSFNDGEGFLIRTDLENEELCLTSAVSEFELFRIFKPFTSENSVEHIGISPPRQLR